MPMEMTLTVLQWTTLVVALLIAVSSLDDLFIDTVFWAMKAKRWLTRRSVDGPPDAEVLVAQPEMPIAIMLPAWQEHDVIASMVENATGTLAYRNFTIFIGTYANDAATIAEVEKIARRHSQVRHVRLPHDGPTCKADCLNHIVADIRAMEKEQAKSFAGMVLHDSEDVLHPLELHLFNYLLPFRDMIQLPVVSLEQRYTDFVAGTYMDEFAECHTKDLVVRQRLAKTVPSAGVGTCFSNRAIAALEEDGDPFNTATLTEDYDIGNRLAARDMATGMALYPVTFRTRRNSFPGMGKDRIVDIEMPLCVREHFPGTFTTSYRQKARWILGIALQGWMQLGWSRSGIENYFLARDRKVLVTPTLTMLAYALVFAFAAIGLWSAAAGHSLVAVFRDAPFLEALLWFNAGALALRLGQRIYFVKRLYGFGHAVMTVPRLVVLSFINFAASMRALRIFLAARRQGRAIVWDKTMHRFPSDEWLGQNRRRLGEILLSWDAVTSPALEKALLDQKAHGGRLGDLLIDCGAIDENVLTDALAMQAHLPRALITQDMVRDNLGLLDTEVMTRLNVLPFGCSKDGEVMLAMARPLPSGEMDWMRNRLGKPFRQHIVPQGQIETILDALVRQPHVDAVHHPAPSLPELLVEQGVMMQGELRQALAGYDVARHGTIGAYLVGQGAITSEHLHDLMAMRDQAAARMQTLPVEERLYA